MPRLFQHVTCGATFHDLSVRHDDHVVGDRFREVDVVGREEQRAPGGGERAQGVGECAAAGGIERRRGLVHEQQRRIERQGAGNGHALRLAAGDLVGIGCPAMGHAQRREQRVGHAAGVLAGGPERVYGRQRDVFVHGEVREERVLLEHHAHRAAQLSQRRLARQWPGRERHAIHRDVPGVERLERHDRPQHGALARAAHSHERAHAPRGEVERDIAQHLLRGPGVPACETELRHLQQQAGGQWRRGAHRFHRASRRRARRDSGRDMARYMAPHASPGTSQLPTLVA